MTITDEAREAWKYVTQIHALPRVADAIRSLVAALGESEFRRKHQYQSGTSTIGTGFCNEACFDPCFDPRHAWKPATEPDSQWRKWAEEELSK